MDQSEQREGPSDKFSARNRVHIQVDHDICAGFGDCVTLLPRVFALNDENLAVVLDPEAANLQQLNEAADICPVSAILLFDESGRQVAPEL